MQPNTDTPEFRPDELAELSALADGTLDPARRKQVQARIAASKELSAIYERERRVVGLLHELRATDRAPAELRERIASAKPVRKQRAWTRTRWHFNTGGMFAGMATAAAIVLALLLILPGGTPGAPSVSQAAALGALTAPSGSVPAVGPAGRLTANVQDVYFPYWAKSEGWKARGQRTDRLNGRAATTVYYQQATAWIAYTIVGAPALKAPPASATAFGGGVEYRTLMLDGREVVTWEKNGHTCVLSAPGSSVPPKQLLALAEST
jgi:hypothetical protein